MATNHLLYKIPSPDNDGLRGLTPDKYLKHPDVHGFLPNLDTVAKLLPGADKLSSDPIPKNTDTTMGGYLDRTSKASERDDVHVTADIGDSLCALQKKFDKLDTLEEDLQDTKNQLTSNGKELEKLRSENKDTKDQLTSNGEELKKLRSENKDTKDQLTGELSRVRDLLDVLQEETFSICLGNLVNQMHGKIVSRLPGAVSGPEKPLLRDIPNLIDRGFFEKNIGLNPEYYDMIPQLQRLIKNRNKTAHVTHRDFALMLVSNKDTKPRDYELWGGLFRFCHGRTVEEFAEERRKQLDGTEFATTSDRGREAEGAEAEGAETEGAEAEKAEVEKAEVERVEADQEGDN